MTKAETIWRNTYQAIKNALNDEGTTATEFAMAFNTDELISVRTVNEIERINDREFSRYTWEISKGFRKEDAARTQAFKNMKKSIAKWRTDDAEMKRIIASI
jgi:hypothetical protein